MKSDTSRENCDERNTNRTLEEKRTEEKMFSTRY